MKEKRRRLDVMFSVRFTGEDFRVVCEKAAANGLSVSSYIRSRALATPVWQQNTAQTCNSAAGRTKITLTSTSWPVHMG